MPKGKPNSPLNFDILDEAEFWKKAAIRLARAIVRFQNDDWQRVHTDSTFTFAGQIIKKAKE